MKNLIISILILLLFFPQQLIAQTSKVFFTTYSSSGRVYSDDPSGGNPSILLSDLDRPKPIAIDESVSPPKLYIGILGEGKIIRCDIDGTNAVDIITGQSSINDLELDLVDRKIYWLQNTWDDDQIFKADMDGLNSNISSIYATTTAMRDLWGLALDVANNRLWITERGSTCMNSRLRTMTLSGSSATTLDSNICNPHDIEYYNNHIYFLMDDGLIRANTDGSVQINISASAGDALSLAIDEFNSRVYWTNSSSVVRINLDGTEETTIFSGASSLYGISIGNYGGSMILSPIYLLLLGIGSE